MAPPSVVLKVGAVLRAALRTSAAASVLSQAVSAPVASAMAAAVSDTQSVEESAGGVNGAYFSRLRQINDRNVSQLGFAWEYRTGTYRALEATPVAVGRTLYASGNW